LQKSTAETTDMPPPDAEGDDTVNSDVCDNNTNSTDASAVNVHEQ